MAWNWTRRGALGLLAGAGAAGLPRWGLAASGAKRFRHGVASGDPQTDRVVIWTRLTPDEGEFGTRTVTYEVARDAEFRQIVASGDAPCDALSDHCVQIDVTGLEPGASYYYRFKNGGETSPIGRTRTLPGDDASELRIAVVSCANYPYGFFHAYREIARRDDIDLVLHLGDYLYEYPAGGYADPKVVAQGRQVKPEGELVTLADYRIRHALYKSDPDLQALHAAHPMIAVWDDHEVANDSWKGGAENHQEHEGPWDVRKRAGMRAWREWLPVRLPDPARPEIVYRRFDIGRLASLIMLDTRLIGRDRQLSYAHDMIYRSVPFDFSDPTHPKAVTDPTVLKELPVAAVRRIVVPFDMTGEKPRPILDFAKIKDLDPHKLPQGWAYLPDAERFRDEKLGDPARSMMGAAQEQWAAEQLADSVHRGIGWQIVGQQLLMGRLSAPRITDIIDFSKPTAVSREQLQAIEGLGRMGLPLNLDAWDGYAAARERFYSAIRKANADVVVLSGDSHNSWAFDLADETGRATAVEMAGPAVSSPGFAQYVSAPVEEMVRRFLDHNPELVMFDPHYRGWVEVHVTPEAVTGEWHYVSRVDAPDYRPIRGERLRVAKEERKLQKAG
ncbi:MAG: alkaline phosphatase [Alphaproteobacteria bacterium]|nr:MAG: alkaline phosphatase [Alphaproteobacteria bacterium]